MRRCVSPWPSRGGSEWYSNELSEIHDLPSLAATKFVSPSSFQFGDECKQANSWAKAVHSRTKLGRTEILHRALRTRRFQSREVIPEKRRGSLRIEIPVAAH